MSMSNYLESILNPVINGLHRYISYIIKYKYLPISVLKWREIFIFHYRPQHPGYVPTLHSTITSNLSYFRFTSGHKTFDCVDHNKLWKTFTEAGISDHLTCLLRNLHVGQEATVRTLYGTTDQLKVEKGIWQGCLLSPCLFDLYVEHTMRNAKLDELQAGI